MEMHRKYMATVSCQPNNQACYVRLSVPRPGEKLPLSVKACFGGFNKNNMHEGRIVQIMRTTSDDHTKYVVCNMLDNQGVSTSHEEEPVPEDDCIQFFLASNYFQRGNAGSGMQRDVCIGILNAVFGTPRGDGSSWDCEMTTCPGGFYIRCRMDQFARFIVRRHEIGHCINGIKDLKPKVRPAVKPVMLYDNIAESTRKHVVVVAQILERAGVDNREIEFDVLVDVTGNQS